MSNDLSSALTEVLRAQEDLRRRLRALETARHGSSVSRTLLSDAVMSDGHGLYVPGPIIDGVVTVTPGASSLLTDLALYYKLDESSGVALDSLGSNDLTDNNTVTSAAGRVGTARQFTAANLESLSHTDNATISVGDIDWGVMAHVYLDSLPGVGNFPTIASQYNNVAGGRSWLLGLDQPTSQFRLVVSNDGTAAVVQLASSFGAVVTGTWYHIAAWHDSVANTINIQVNNGTIDSTAHATGVFDAPSVFRVGGRGDVAEAARYWDGRIDELGLWKKVPSAAERAAHFNLATYPFTGVLEATAYSAEAFTLELGADSILEVG